MHGPGPLGRAALVIVLLCGFTGWFQDRVLWQPLRRRGLGLTQLMIVTIGLSLAMQYVLPVLRRAPAPSASLQANPTVSEFGPITMTNQSFVAMGISIVVLAAVGYALLRTRSAARPARSPTTRRWPRPPASTSTR